MEERKPTPAPIRNKLILTAVIGVVCLLIGIAMFLFAKDRMMLFLSMTVFFISLYRVWTLWQVINKAKYEIVEGTCVGIVPKPLRKYRKIRMMDDEGNESALLIGKQSKIKIGSRYRFYFKDTQRFTIGNEYFDSALSSDCFLGFEEVEEISAPESATGTND